MELGNKLPISSIRQASHEKSVTESVSYSIVTIASIGTCTPMLICIYSFFQTGRKCVRDVGEYLVACRATLALHFNPYLLNPNNLPWLRV